MVTRLHHREANPLLEASSSVGPRSRAFRAVALANWFADMAAKKSPATIHGYVADGLVAMWDAIDNVGLGDDAHSTTTAVVSDLSGNGHDITVSNDGTRYSWTAKSRNISLYGSGGTQCALYIADAAEAESIARAGVFVEVCGTGFERGNAMYASPTITRRLYVSSSKMYGGHGSPGASTSTDLTTMHTFAAAWLGEYGVDTTLENIRLFKDGSELALTALWDTEQPVVQGVSIFGSYGRDYQMVYGNWHSTRIYDRVLTDAEIAANHAVDIARFGAA